MSDIQNIPKCKNCDLPFHDCDCGSWEAVYPDEIIKNDAVAAFKKECQYTIEQFRSAYEEGFIPGYLAGHSSGKAEAEKEIERLKDLLREFIMRKQLAFPECEIDLKLWDEGINNQPELMEEISDVLNLGDTDEEFKPQLEYSTAKERSQSDNYNTPEYWEDKLPNLANALRDFKNKKNE